MFLPLRRTPIILKRGPMVDQIDMGLKISCVPFQAFSRIPFIVMWTRWRRPVRRPAVDRATYLTYPHAPGLL